MQIRSCTQSEGFVQAASPDSSESTQKIKADLHALHALALPGPAKRWTKKSRAYASLLHDFLGSHAYFGVKSLKDAEEISLTAKHGGDNPADHLRGRFTDFMREDFRRAWSIYYMKKEIAVIDAGDIAARVKFQSRAMKR